MKPLEPIYQLHPYQHQVLDDILAALMPDRGAVVQPQRRAVAHLPTGAGKTRIACHASCAILNRHHSVGKTVIWLASTEELCDQAYEDLTWAWKHLGNRPVYQHQLWGNHNLDANQIKEGFVVAGLPKLWALAQKDYSVISRLAENAALVVFDEAHQAIAQTYRFITEQLIAFQTPLLGLTATPGRTAEITEQDQELADMFHAQKITIDSRGHQNPVAYLTRQGFLADPEYIPININSHVDVTSPEDDHEYTSSDLRKIGTSQDWLNAIVETTIRALRSHRRVIVFCPSVESTKACSTELQKKGYKADSILGATPPEERQKTIQRFKSSEEHPRAILNYGVLTAGFDARKTSCVIVGRPTTSLVLYSQMVGRALRGPMSGGNRTCQIYTVVDRSLPAFQSVQAGFQNWEAIWRA